ncbi:MAG: phosphate--acyl-ACP acyltransferase, partial [Planctomycetota bacterium]
MVRIAVDAMGGDHAPGTVVDGVLGAAELFDDLELILVGHQDAIAKQFQEKGKDPSAFEIIHAAEVIGMDEAPVVALRRKRDSSIRVMVSLLKAGRCDAVFSAGNTGAVVAASTMLLGLLPGVLRAGIAVTLPIRETPVVLIDVGANVQCKPQHLFQYGL